VAYPRPTSGARDNSFCRPLHLEEALGFGLRLNCALESLPLEVRSELVALRLAPLDLYLEHLDCRQPPALGGERGRGERKADAGWGRCAAPGWRWLRVSSSGRRAEGGRQGGVGALPRGDSGPCEWLAGERKPAGGWVGVKAVRWVNVSTSSS